MPPNVAACTMRLVSKMTAAQFGGPNGYTIVQLSQPVPPHAFAHKWAAPGVMRPLTLKQRHRLLCLTAASGSIPNMEVALAHVGFIPTEWQWEEMLEAAAGAGRLEMCKWLLQRIHNASSKAIRAAARSGQWAVCELFLTHVKSFTDMVYTDMVCDAVRGGHPDLLEQLLQRLHQQRTRIRPGPDNASPGSEPVSCLDGDERDRLLVAAAEGCDLQTLQSLRQRCHGAVPAAAARAGSYLTREMLRHAAASPSPDWQAKVEWIETLAEPDYKQYGCVFGSAACTPDAASRMSWLRQRGYEWSSLAQRAAVGAAARTRNVPALKYLIAEGDELTHIQDAVLRSGLVHLLSAAALSRLTFEPGDVDVAVHAAAQRGDLSLLQWAVEHLGASVPSGDHEADAAHMARVARTGNVPMLSWMYERYCALRCLPTAAATFTAAAEGGCEEALEWLAERGCPMEEHGSAYVRAAKNGDLATLHCLQRLGCPWGPAGVVFTACIRQSCPLPVMRWLAEAGCPVDWEAAHRVAKQRGCGFPAGVRSWVAEQRRQQRERQQ